MSIQEKTPAGIIDVAAAIIKDDDRILVARRSPGEHLAGHWEFPGGKIEPGESPEECLVRELWEEMGIGISVGAFVGESLHHYPGKSIRLMAYYASLVDGSPSPTVHDRILWANQAELGELDLAAADRPLVSMIQSSMPGFYQDRATDYFNTTIGIDPCSFLKPFAEKLQPGASVLDIGCGSGRDLIWLKERGFYATGFEYSTALAELARRHSNCRVIQGDFFLYDFSELSFDAVLLVGALVHLSEEQLVSVLKKIVQALIPDGLLYVTLKEGDGISKSDDGRTFFLWSAAKIERFLARSGLVVISINRQISRLRQSDVWLGCMARRNGRDHKCSDASRAVRRRIGKVRGD